MPINYALQKFAKIWTAYGRKCKKQLQKLCKFFDCKVIGSKDLQRLRVIVHETVS